MGMFDDTARQACKMDGTGQIAWLRRLAPRPLAVEFDRWDDTRRTSWPGGPERTDDVVAVLRRTDVTAAAWMIIEIETEPQVDGLARLGVYELLLAMEVGALVAGGPAVYGVVIWLTGEPPAERLSLGQAEGPPGHLVMPLGVILGRVSAAATLTAIEAGETALSVL